MVGFFDKVPENLFSVLSRKYKKVYVIALLALYDALKLYKTRIKKSDYAAMLDASFAKLTALKEIDMSLFDLNSDRNESRNYDEEVPESAEPVDENSPFVKISYIIRKLEITGWIEIEKDIKTNIEYIYVPTYSFKILSLICEMASNTSTYFPLVHQIYSELKLEEEKEDDYMFRSILNAKKNVADLELNVTLLYHSICVFGHRLTYVFSPNEALRQHFDSFQTEINEKMYHPMKTFDSLGLFAVPTVKILNNWLSSERVMEKLVSQASNEPNMIDKSKEEVERYVFVTIQGIIDVLNKLNKSFDDIDEANASYTDAVQKKVNYLSSGDKTVQGKIRDILVKASTEIKKSNEDYDQMEFIEKMANTIGVYQQGCLDFESLTPPYHRGERVEVGDPVLLDDPFDSDKLDFDDDILSEYSRYGSEGIDDFMILAFGDKHTITTLDIDFKDMDAFILFILVTVRGELDLSFYSMEKIDDQEIQKQGFILPNFKFTKKSVNKE
ncbi:MAG TPA: hypothetical protein DCY93_03665 [Firmicutes bacterium]|nr:hypothetical protein [Bacillota bacterium]